MNYAQIKDRVSALSNSRNYSTSEIAEIETLYREVLGKKVRDCNCPDRYRDAVLELRIFTKNHLTMEKSKFRLKPGVVIVPSNDSEVYTNNNLTDEVAIAFLKERPGARGLFAELPENVDELLAEKPDDKPADDKPEVPEETETDKGPDAESEQEKGDEKPADESEQEHKPEPTDEAEKPGENESEKTEPSEGTDNGEKSGKAAGNGLNPEVYAAIKARLEAGETKSAIIADYVGVPVDGKALTKYGVEKYFAAIKAE